MKVRDLILALNDFDPDMDVGIPAPEEGGIRYQSVEIVERMFVENGVPRLRATQKEGARPVVLVFGYGENS